MIVASGGPRMKTILVPTQSIAAMKSALEVAVLLARRTGAYIEGFPLRIAIPPVCRGGIDRRPRPGRLRCAARRRVGGAAPPVRNLHARARHSTGQCNGGASLLRMACRCAGR